MAPPVKYKPTYVETGRAMAHAGATDREIAEYLSVAERTLHRWKHDHPAFESALTTGKEAADRRVEQSLYRKAVGYSFDAEKIFHHEGAVTRVPYVEHVAPSDTAAIFWLKNRKPEQYREKFEVDMKIDIAAILAERRARVAEAQRRAPQTPVGEQEGSRDNDALTFE